METFETERHGPFFLAAIDRPEAHHAINFTVMEELEEIVTRVENDPEIRAFVLSGTGETFIAGGDLKEFHTIETPVEAEKMAARMHRLLHRIEQLPCWTIAAVNGPAYGGGCEIMLAFDFCAAAHSSSFGFTQGKFYLPPGWGGLLRLAERVGRSTALQWLAENAVVKPEEALQKGLINKLFEDDEFNGQVLEWADKLTLNDRDYIRHLKEHSVFNRDDRRKAMSMDLEPFAQFWTDEQHFERVERFLSRKKNS